MCEILLVPEETAFSDWHIANALVARIRSSHLVIDTARSVGDQTLFILFRRHALDAGHLSPQVIEIVDCHLDLGPSLAAARLQRSASVEHRHHICAKSAESHHQSALKACAICEQKYD